jgi:thiamine-phosphate pyrophosphorylase
MMMRQSIVKGQKDWSRGQVPPCWLMTDARLGNAMPKIAARQLPPRSVIVIRPHALDGYGITQLARGLRRIARARRHLLLWGGVGQPAGYDGVHVRDGRPVRHSRLVSRPVHNRREATMARTFGSDVVLISPVFTTRSHTGGRTLRRRGFAQLASFARCRVIALGGMTDANFAMLRVHGADGWAAIDAWLNLSDPDR